MPGFAASMLIISGVLLVLGVATVWMSLRLFRRVVAQGRRRVLDIRISLLPPGPRRDARILRRQLAIELRSLRQTVTSLPNGQIFQADPARVLAEAAEYVVVLDRELAMIETFPDRGRRHAALQFLQPQVRTLLETIYSARDTMLRTAAAERERGLTRLSESVAHEAASLRNYEQAKRGLTI